MPNEFKEISDQRAPVTYTKLLSAITRTLARVRYDYLLFREQNHDESASQNTDSHYVFDVDRIAAMVAEHFPEKDLLFEARKGMQFVSVHFADLLAKQAFTDELLQLSAQLRTQIQRSWQKREDTQEVDVGEKVRKLFTPSEDFTKGSGNSRRDAQQQLVYSNLTRTFRPTKQRLHLRLQKTEAEPRLRGHKVTIQVGRLKDFEEQISQGLIADLQSRGGCDESEILAVKTELQRRKDKPNSDLQRLSEALVDNSLARIQRAVQSEYLRWLAKIIKKGHAPTQKRELHVLERLITRLEKLETFVSDPQRRDSDFQVGYQGERYHLRELFTRAELLDTLPVITLIGGMLGQVVEVEKTQKSFTFGIKLKLNGSVQAHGGDGLSAFEYHLAFLNPASKQYQAREKATQNNQKARHFFFEKQLKIALLFVFLFTHLDDVHYDPTPDAETFLTCFRLNDENDDPKKALLKQLYEEMREVKGQYLDPLRDLLVAFLQNLKSEHEPHQATLTLSLDRKILLDIDSIVTHHAFFQRDWEENGGKAVLKYVSIQDDTVGNGALCKLPVTLDFQTMYYDFDTSPAETIQMSYALDKVLMLPLIIQPFPSDNQPADPRLQHFVFPQKCLIFSYRDRDKSLGTNTPRAFVYRLTYLLLTYLFLKLLLDDAIPVAGRRRVFLPLVCLHTKPENEEHTDTDMETFLHDFSKVLAHMLGEDYHASSQGIQLETLVPGKNDFEKKKRESQMVNALSSLYNALPHRFLVPKPVHLEKLAIIVVSSRKADVSSKSALAGITVYGETLGMHQQREQLIQAQTLTTFSDNVRDSNLLMPPEVLIEQAHLCYQQGYRHLLYVAQTPYSHTLRLPSSEVKPNLYFMNETAIRAMRQVGEGMKVYPIFYDKYWVIKKAQPNDPYSLYIEDLRELGGVASDKNKQTIVFLNVFNGLMVPGKRGAIEQRLYNGVISYGTLVNMYEDTTYYQYIWQDLLGERAPGSLSSDLLAYLELLHFLRNEKGYPDRFKLDPYSTIIGDKSVGKRATLPHMLGKTRFNSLAFLTLVRSVLHAQQSEGK